MTKRKIVQPDLIDLLLADVARLACVVFFPNLPSPNFAKIEPTFPHLHRSIFNAEPRLCRSIC